VINELFSVLYLVHDDPKSQAFADWLHKHVDSQNCPHWSFLGFAWKTSSCQPVGHYVTGFVTANWKKSVSDLHFWTDVISQAAQYIIDQLIVTPEHLLKVTPATLCPINHCQDYQVLPIHTDPFVHLSPLIFAIVRLRRFLWDELLVRMSCYLRDEMIVSALIETTNMYQFSKFAGEHYKLWQSMGTNLVELGSTFIDAFQIWLRTNYPSNEGNHLRNNEKEGTVRYMCCKNTPTLVVTSHNNVQVFHDEMKRVALHSVTDVVYKNTIRNLEKQIEGASDLKIQKMIYVCAVVGGHLSMGWINHCRPGSPRHLVRFKKQDFALTTQNQVGQVGQVVKVIAARYKLPLPVAEESVCSKLKTENLAASQDMAVKGQDLYSCQLNKHCQAKVWSLHAATNKESRLISGRFSCHNDAHYRPTWCRGKEWAHEVRLKLRFTLDENMKFNMKTKVSPSQQKLLWDELVFSNDHSITSKNIQVLLNKNRALVIDVEFVAEVFKMEPSVLKRAIRVEPTGKGFAAYINGAIFKKIKVLRHQVKQVWQIDQVNTDRQPLLDQLDGELCAYGSSSAAVVGLLFHLLMNVQRKTGKSWTFPCLSHTKELVLVVPVTQTKTTLEVVCTLFRHKGEEGTQVMRQYFDHKGKSFPAFEVATDDDGYFNEDTTIEDA
jgi:hypothetical protein